MKIDTVKAISDNVVEIIDSEGSRFLMNLTHWINLPILNFHDLKDVSYFKQVSVAENHNTIEWPNGQDIAPEDLEKFSVPID